MSTIGKQNKRIIPQRLSGFRDFFATDVRIREYVIDIFKKVFEKYGYEPLQTPALEYTEIFSGEVGEEAEKLFYRFTDNGGRDVMLKYEVMISMCRAVSENINALPLPYKRYQIQNVWRAEKPQKGRFREFTQCDADTIGSSSVVCDAEFIQMGIEALQTLGFKKFKAQISNRKLLNGIVKYAGGNEHNFIPICLSIDKLPKIGAQMVKKELLEKRKVGKEVADRVLDVTSSSDDISTLIQRFRSKLRNIPVAVEGLDELEQIFNYLKTAGVPPQFYQFNPCIARGLAYYTGPIWEFEITDGNIGSVAGCGRYDNTIGRFLGRKIPATGGSFGIERIIEIVKDQKMLTLSPTSTQVLVTLFDKNNIDESLKTANFLRSQGISTLLYPETDALQKQLKYASLKQIPFVIILGPDEIKTKKVALKKMRTGEQTLTSLENAVNLIQKT